MSVTNQETMGGDEYYQDYMMVLEVFDKMDPAEQAAQNASGNAGADAQQQSDIHPSTLNGAFEQDGGVFGGGMPGLSGFLGAQDTVSTGRAKRDRSQAGDGPIDMDGHALASMPVVNYGGYPAQGAATQGQYLDPATGMGMSAHLMPSQPTASTSSAASGSGATASTGTKKRGASTVDDLLSHVAMAKQRRRERNKVLARKTRIKKKVELEQLKSQIDHLTNENSRLRSLVAEAGIEYHEDKPLNMVTSDGLEGMMQEIANDSSIFSTVTSTSINGNGVGDGGLPQYPPLPNFQQGNTSDDNTNKAVTDTGSMSAKASNTNFSGLDPTWEKGLHSEGGKSMDEDKESGTNSGTGNSDSDGDSGKTSEERQDASDDKGSDNSASTPADKSNPPVGRATRTSSRRASGGGNSADASATASRANSRRTRMTRGKAMEDDQNLSTSSLMDVTREHGSVQKIVSEILDADSADPMMLAESFKTSTSRYVTSDEGDDTEDRIIRCCVVEDSLVQAKLMCKHLLSLSSEDRIIKIYRCASGEGAVEFLEKKGGHNCDLWFIDQNLGHSEDLMKGSDVIAKIRDRPENANITIVGVTTNPLAHFVEMNAAGVDMVWGKEDIDGKGMTNRLSRLIIPKATATLSGK